MGADLVADQRGDLFDAVGRLTARITAAGPIDDLLRYAVALLHDTLGCQRVALYVDGDGTWRTYQVRGRQRGAIEAPANPDEVALKRKLAALVSTVNVLVDGSKLGKVAFAPCLAVSEMHRVVTDDTAAPELVAALRDRGVEVLVA